MRRQTTKDRETIKANLKELGIQPHGSNRPAFAFISEGRWVANCEICNGAEFVTEGQVMTCGTCGAVSQVTWPDKVDEIEKVLDERPNMVNRNFLPGETVALLKAENREHGL